MKSLRTIIGSTNVVGPKVICCVFAVVFAICTPVGRRRAKTIWRTAPLSCSIAQHAFGTSIVVVRTSSEIVVAADSMLVWLTDDGRRWTVPICKIRQAGSVFFAIGGASGNDSSGYDPFRIAVDACSLGTNMMDKISRFETLVHSHLSNEFAAIVKDKVLGKAGFEPRGVFFVVAFFGVEGRTMQLHIREWRAQQDENGTVTAVPNWIYDCPGKDCKYADDPSYRQIIPLAANKEAIEYRDTHRNEMASSDTVSIARRLVKVAMDAHPDFIGEPTAVLRLHASGAEWVGAKGPCLAVQPHTSPAPQLSKSANRRKSRRRR